MSGADEKTNLKVVEFRKAAPGRAHELCRDLFRKQAARDKEMVAAAFVVVHHDGTVGSAYVSEDHVFPLVGAVAMLNQRLLTEVIK